MSNHHNRWRTGPENNVVACFLATHVNELDRLDSLRNALRSIKGQTTPAQLFVSWSAADELKVATRAVLKQEGTSLTTCYMHKKPLTQFQHYKYLAEKLRDADAQQPEPVATWVLFSDDDDVWHPMRLQFYCMLLESIDVAERGRSQAVTCPWWAIRSNEAASLPAASSAEEVEGHMRDGRWFLQDFSRYENGTEACEHWCSLVKLGRVLDFYQMAPAGLVSSTFCDVAFARFFSKGHDEDVHTFRVSYLKDQGFPWLYAYNASADLDVEKNILSSNKSGTPREPGTPRPGKSHASADSYAPTDAERAIAKEMLPKLLEQFKNATRDPTTWAFELARERRTLCVIAATRLWVPSTVTMRETADGPALEPTDKAGAIAGLCFSDLEVIWRKHSHTAEERALKLFIMDYYGGRALRAALNEFGFEHADLISNAFSEQCATLRDQACLKACGFLAATSATHNVANGAAAKPKAAVIKPTGAKPKKGTQKPRGPPSVKTSEPARLVEQEDDDEPRIVEIEEPRLFESVPAPAKTSPRAKAKGGKLDETGVSRARVIKSLFVHAVAAVDGVAVRAVAAAPPRQVTTTPRHEVGRAATAASFVVRRERRGA